MLKKFKLKSKRERQEEELHRIHDALDIFALLENSLEMRIPDYDKTREVDGEDEFHVLTNGDIIEAGHILLDLHNALKVEMDYMPLEAYEKFPKVKHIVRYFMKRYSYLENKKDGTL